MSSTVSAEVPSGTRVVMLTRYSTVSGSWLGSGGAALVGGERSRLGVGQAEVGERVQQVGVWCDALRADPVVGKPGVPPAVDVVGETAAVGIGDRLGPVVAQDVRKHQHRGGF